MIRWHWRLAPTMFFTMAFLLSLGAPAQVELLVEDEIVTDQNNDGVADEGDTLRYQVTITNLGTEPADIGALEITLDGNLGLVAGSLNSTPVASDAQADGTEDEQALIELRVAELDGDTVNLAITEQPAQGEAAIVRRTDTGGFLLRYSPDTNFNGDDAFDVRVQDADGNAAEARISVAIAPANDTPAALDGSGNGVEDATTSFTLRGSDIDGDSLTFEIDTPPASGSLSAPISTGPAEARVDYTPDPNFNGDDSFTFIVRDAEDASPTAEMALTIAPVNDPPVAFNLTLTTPEDEPGTAIVQATDIDDAGVTFTVAEAPERGTLTVAVDAAKSALLTYTPEADYFGPDEAVVLVTDGSGATDTATVNITVVSVNDAPLAFSKEVTTNEDTAVEIMLDAAQPEVGKITFTVDTTGTAGSLSPILQISSDVARLTYTPAADFEGSDSFTYTADDGQGGIGEAEVTITVVPVPDAVVAEDDTFTLIEDGVAELDLFANDYNPDAGDRLALSAFDAPENGIAEVVPDAGLRYTPFPDFNGTEEISYTVRDSDGFTSTATAVVTVSPVPDGVEAADDTFFVTAGLTANLDVLANDTDPDGGALALVSVGTPAAGVATINGDGTIAYTPNVDVISGEDAFSYDVENAAGGSVTGQVQIIVTSTPETRVSGDAAVSAVRDAATTLPVLANDSAESGAALWIVDVEQPANGAVSLTEDAAGRPALRYEPIRRTDETEVFVYTITDGDSTATGEARVEVETFDLPPVPFPDAYFAPAGGSVDLKPLLNDFDPDGDALVIGDVSSPQHGIIDQIGATTLRYTPEAGFTGIESLWYAASDGEGASAIAAISIQVAAAPAVLRYVIDYAACIEGGSVVITPLRNDYNPSAVPVPLGAVTQPANGAVEVRIDQTVLFTPAPGFFGTTTFTYRWSGDTSNAPAGQVAVTVLPLPEAPELEPLAYAADEDTTILVNPAIGLLDPLSGGSLSVAGAGQSIKGATELADGGLIAYTPQADYFGEDQFLYTLETPAGLRISAPATVTVAPVNDTPSFAGPGQLTLFEDEGAQTIPGFYFDIIAGPPNEASQGLTFSFALSGDTVLDGQPSVSPSGALTLTTEPDAFGSGTVTVTLTDDGTPPLSFTTELALTVNPINDAPSFTAAAGVTVPKNSGPFLEPNWAFNASPGPRNEADQVLNYTVTVEDDSLFFTQPSVSPIGTLTFTPRAGAEGTTNIVVQLIDDGGTANNGKNASLPVTRTITVGTAPVNKGARP